MLVAETEAHVGREPLEQTQAVLLLEEATLETAIQQIVHGSHQSLLVRRGSDRPAAFLVGRVRRKRLTCRPEMNFCRHSFR